VNGLLFIFRQLLTPADSTPSVVGEATASAFLVGNVKALADGRNREVVTFSEKFFVVDVGDVIDAQAARSKSRVGVLAAGLDVEDICQNVRPRR